MKDDGQRSPDQPLLSSDGQGMTMNIQPCVSPVAGQEKRTRNVQNRKKSLSTQPHHRRAFSTEHKTVTTTATTEPHFSNEQLIGKLVKGLRRQKRKRGGATGSNKMRTEAGPQSPVSFGSSFAAINMREP